MTERERLTVLIEECTAIHESGFDPDKRISAEALARYLLANGVILPPCKLGDKVYEIYNDTDACNDCPYYSSFYGMDSLCDKDGNIEFCPEVSDKPLCDKQRLIIQPYIVKDLYQVIGIIYSFGKTVFLSHEEAEAALERRKEGNAT